MKTARLLRSRWWSESWDDIAGVGKGRGGEEVKELDGMEGLGRWEVKEIGDYG
jgi:hypothetical protein